MFNKKFQATVKFLKDHATDYSSIPTIDQISATTNVDLERIDGVNDNHVDWFLDSFERFCRHKALEKAILESTDLLESADYGAVDIKSVELIKRLDAFLGHPDFDPHGDPIPDKDGNIKKAEKRLLSELIKNQIGICVGVKESSPEYLQYLDKKKIKIGFEIP